MNLVSCVSTARAGLVLCLCSLHSFFSQLWKKSVGKGVYGFMRLAGGSRFGEYLGS